MFRLTTGDGQEDGKVGCPRRGGFRGPEPEGDGGPGRRRPKRKGRTPPGVRGDIGLEPVTEGRRTGGYRG